MVVVSDAPRPDARCRVCTKPLISVSDDPHDPDGRTHPTCDPVDPPAWKRFLGRDTRMAS
jgi:hypothetical protein